MSFLNPTLAILGLVAVAAPILIHLLNRRKYDRVTWAAMRFLINSVEKNRKRIQLEDILLLFLRCLVVALLGFALARPTLGCSAARLLGRQGVTAVVIIDNSYSMSATDGVRSRFDQAKLAADQLVTALPNGSSVAVFLASDGAPNTVIPEPTLDLVKARRTIADAKAVSRGSDLFPSIEKAVDAMKGLSGASKEIYIFTDGQLAAWKQLDRARDLLTSVHSDIASNVIFVGGREDQNLAVTQLRSASGLTAVDRELRFDAEVRNFGSKAADAIRVSLRVDKGQPTDEQNIPTIPPGESRVVSLHAKLREEGYHTVTASIPADHLPADDQRTIAMRAIGGAKVLIVDGTFGPTPTRDDESFYLRHALVPVPPSEADRYFMKVTTVSPTDLDSARFEGYDAVILTNVPEIPPRATEQLADYVRRGGGLVVFPGDAINTSFYNDTLGAKFHLLPATFGNCFGDARSEAEYQTLKADRPLHPIAAIWGEVTGGALASTKLFRAYELIPAEEATGAGAPRIVLSIAQGVGPGRLLDKPAVMERTYGLGRVVQFATTASSRWTNLPVAAGGGVFLPLMDRVLASIVQRQDDTLNVAVGGAFIFHPGDEAIGTEALFFRPDRGDTAADSRRVELPGTGLPTVAYDQTDLAGAYAMKLASGVTVKFAVQQDADNNESSLDQVTAEQEAELKTVASVTHWSQGENVGNQIASARHGAELWEALTWLVLGLAVVEMGLATWFSRAK